MNEQKEAMHKVVAAVGGQLVTDLSPMAEEFGHAAVNLALAAMIDIPATSG